MFSFFIVESVPGTFTAESCNWTKRSDHIQPPWFLHSKCNFDVIFVPKFSKWVFPQIMVPQNGWFIMENPIKIDDLGVPLFLETPKCYFSDFCLSSLASTLRGLLQIWCFAKKRIQKKCVSHLIFFSVHNN